MTVWAVSSWLSSMIVIFPADSGSFSATLPITTTWSPSSMMIGRRSSTTFPPSVWMNWFLSSNSLTSWRCVLVVTSTHAVCTRGRSRAALRRPICAGARETRQNGSQPFLGRRQSLRDRRLHVDIRIQLVDRGVRDLCSDRVVLDHVPRDRLEAGLVERRVLDVEGEHPHEREQNRDDGQHACGDQACPRDPSGL